MTTVAALRRRRPALQGQATAEILVVLIALAALFVLIPLIGKYQDIAHRTQMAARYVAWQSTVRNDAEGGRFASADELALDVRRRYFGPNGAPVLTGEVTADTAAFLNPLWVDHRGERLLRSLAHVGVDFGPDRAADPTSGFSDGGTLDSVYLLSPGRFDLRDRGIFTGSVTVRLADVDAPWLAPFDALGLTVRRHASVMPDSWAVADAETVEARATRDGWLYPGQRMGDEGILDETLRDVVSFAMLPLEDSVTDPSVRPPYFGQTDFWRDVVPKDRLVEPRR